MRVNRCALFAEESEEHQPPHIERGQRRRDQANGKHALKIEVGIEQDFVLREEAGHAGNAGDRQSSDNHRPEGDGHLASQPTHFSHVLLAVQAMNHGARAKEQQGFEERVGH